MGLPVGLVSVLILAATIVICEGVVYTPTIINACVYRDDESTRLNVWWKFEEALDLSGIEGFTITFTSLDGRSKVLYQYLPGSLNGIDSDGRTYVRNIVFNINRNDTMIAVSITVNSTSHPQSSLFKVQQCANQDTTTTTVIVPTTRATRSSSSSSSSTSISSSTTSALSSSPSTSSSFTFLVTSSTSSILSTMTTFHEVSSTTIKITPLPSSASPTNVIACTYQANNGLFKLNVQWEFEDAIDVSKIEGFTIASERTVVYHYDRNSTIDSDGKTYARKIPLFNITNIIRISVYITIDSIVHPQSKPVTIERCTPQDITTTNVSTVTDTPISSISILSSTIVSTSLITSTQKMMPATSNVVPRETPTGIQLYIPTITSACIQRSNGTYRLNIQWKFDESTDLSEIDEFVIFYMNSSVLVEVYHYPDDKNMDVIIVGKTSASYIPLPDITSTTIQVRVASVRSRTINPPSEKFNSTECSTELNSSTSVTTSTTTTTTTTTTLATTILATPITTTAVTSAMPTVTGNEQTVLVSKLPTSSTLPLSPAPSSPTSLSNMSSSNESDDFPIIVVVIAVAIICLLLLFIMIVLIIFIIRLKCKSCKNKDLESEAESVKPLQNGSLLFRQADKVNYLKTPSQIIDSQYNTVQQQSDCNGNASNQSQRYSEAHKYDVPANNKVANNDYDHIDFQYEQADHPFQQSYTNGGPHVTNYEEGPQQKYNVLVHSSSMDKLGKDCPNPPSITTDHYNKLHDNNCANTSQAHLRNDEAYYSVPLNATLSTNNGSAIENPHDYDRLSEKP